MLNSYDMENDAESLINLVKAYQQTCEGGWSQNKYTYQFHDIYLIEEAVRTKINSMAEAATAHGVHFDIYFLDVFNTITSPEDRVTLLYIIAGCGLNIATYWYKRAVLLCLQSTFESVQHKAELLYLANAATFTYIPAPSYGVDVISIKDKEELLNKDVDEDLKEGTKRISVFVE